MWKGAHLVPRVLGAPVGDLTGAQHVLGGATVAGGAGSAGAVSAAGGAGDSAIGIQVHRESAGEDLGNENDKEGHEQELHCFEIRTVDDNNCGRSSELGAMKPTSAPRPQKTKDTDPVPVLEVAKRPKSCL